eukprot:6213206-Pleurochrysis_carterae.AAC.3
MKLGLVDRVCKSPIQRVPTYDVSDYANQYYTPMDGFSINNTHPDGYNRDSTPRSLIFSITSEYEPPAFDYSNGVCYMPPLMATMSISITNIRFAHLIRPTLERLGRILRRVGIRLPLPVLLSVCSCLIALGANFIIVPTSRPLLAVESTPSMAHLAINACQSTPTAVSAFRDYILLNRGRYPHIYLFRKGMAENVRRYVLSIRQVQAGRSTPSNKGLHAVHGLHLKPLIDTHPRKHLSESSKNSYVGPFCVTKVSRVTRYVTCRVLIECYVLIMDHLRSFASQRGKLSRILVGSSPAERRRVEQRLTREVTERMLLFAPPQYEATEVPARQPLEVNPTCTDPTPLQVDQPESHDKPTGVNHSIGFTFVEGVQPQPLVSFANAGDRADVSVTAVVNLGAAHTAVTESSVFRQIGGGVP